MEGAVDSGTTNLPDLLDRCLFTGVVVVDGDLAVTAMSDEARILLSIPADVGDCPPLDVLPHGIQQIITEALRTVEARPNVFLVVPGRDGGAKPLRVSTSLLAGTAGKPGGVVAVIHDISPARQLDHKLRQMDRLASIGTLSASMAHEVKNALVAVKTFVDLLIAKNQDSSLADIVGREMQRINSIVSQMLRFGGPAKPSLGTIHLHQVVEQSLAVVHHHVEGRKISVTRSLEASPDIVPGDAYQLEQAFLNLFLNAFDAMGVQGELVVRTEYLPANHPDAGEAPKVRVTVQDNGMGIPQENLGRLFEPFFTTKPSGTGLGLPITRRIIEEHRGRIEVRSEVHHGTCFTLTLPSAARQP